jgi:hypothetical protein
MAEMGAMVWPMNQHEITMISIPGTLTEERLVVVVVDAGRPEVLDEKMTVYGIPFSKAPISGSSDATHGCG